MLDGILAAIDDGIWAHLDTPTPRFVLHGSEDQVFDTALHLAGFCHPYFGRAELVLIDRPVAVSSLEERFEVALKNGLLSVRLGTVDEATIKDSFVFCYEGNPDEFLRFNPKKVFVLQGNHKDPRVKTIVDKSLVLSPDDPYHAVRAFLSLYGKPLEEFVLPKGEPEYSRDRDWRYLGPARSLHAFDAIRDELRIALKENDGSLCPVDSYDVLLKELRGETVEPTAFYEALKRCYTEPCLLRDMASYIHDLWTLRTLAFHPERDAKKSMMVPYPVLLAQELPKLKEGFAKDILFSDYLVPLLYVRDYVLFSKIETK